MNLYKTFFVAGLVAGCLILASCPVPSSAQEATGRWWKAFRVPLPAPPVMEWGTIRGITTDAEGKLYLADYSNSRVLRLDASREVDAVWAGSPVTRIAAQAQAEADIREPIALSARPNGELWIGTVGGIKVFDAKGRYLRALPYFDEDGDTIGLTDMIIADRGDRLFGSRGGAKGVLVFGSDGRYLDTWMGPDGERLRGFGGLAVHSDGQVLVSDIYSHRILVYGQDGTLHRYWGEQGDQNGQLERPGSLAIEKDGNVLVVDAGNQRVQRFAADGQHLSTWNGPGNAMEDFTGPSKIHVAEDGSIFLVDASPLRILHLSKDGDLIGEPLTPAPAARGPHMASRWVQAEDGALFGHDSSSGRVMHFQPNGLFRNEWPTRPEDPMSGSAGEGIGLSPSGDIVVPVGAEVRTFDRNGGIQAVFTRTLSDNSLAGVAADLAVGPDGAIFVAEPRGLQGVLAFEPDGRRRWAVGGRGNVAGRFESPSGLATKDGMLWIADPNSTRLDRYGTADGELRDVVLDSWNPDCHPDRPEGGLNTVFLVDDGRVLATSWSADTVGFIGEDGRWLSTLGGRGFLDRPSFALHAQGGHRIFSNSRRQVLIAYETAPRETWRTETFDNPWLTGLPFHVDDIATASLGEGEIPARRSARLSRWTDFGLGSYAFDLSAQGGVRLWVDDVLVMDQWFAEATAESATYRSPWAARREVVLEFRSPAGAGSLEMSRRALHVETPAPTVTLTPSATATSRFVATPLPTATPGPFAKRGTHTVFLPRVLRQGADESAIESEAWQAVPGIDVRHYDIDLSMHSRTGDSDLLGVVTITLRATMSLDDVSLHIEPSAVHIGQVRVGDSPAGWSIVPGEDNGFGLSGSRLVIPLPSPAAAGDELSLRIEYRIDAASYAHNRGFVLDGGDEDDALLSTRSAPYFTRFWLPSHDHLSDPARVTYTLRVPSGMRAAANGLPTHGDYDTGLGTDASGLDVFRYQRSEELQTYLMRVAMGAMAAHVQPICFDHSGPVELVDCAEAEEQINLVYFHRGSEPLSGWPFAVTMPPGRGDLEVLVYFSRLFGTYPNDKLGVLSASHPYSMEYAGLMALTSHRDNRHEFLHGWWGNSVRIRDWRDFWIKESLTTYLTAYWDERYFATLPMLNIQPCRAGEIIPAVEPDFLVDFHSGRRRDPYEKGAAAWHDLRWRLADAAGTHIWDDQAIELFEGTLAALYRDHAHDFLTTEGLLKWLRSNLAERFTEAGFDGSPVDIDRLITDWGERWALH